MEAEIQWWAKVKLCLVFVDLKVQSTMRKESTSSDIFRTFEVKKQIYRQMDIGTAKPTPEEQAQIAHHMIDIVAPDEDYDAVQFSKQAGERVAEIADRGLIPFVVGGTGLYNKALLHGLFQTEPVDPKIRNRLKQELEKDGSLPWDECLRTLKRDTRRFAKRQFTWFGADPQIKWYQPEQLDRIFDAVDRFLE